MLTAARLAVSDMFSAQFRAVLLKSLALTIALLIGLWIAIEGLVSWAVDIKAYPWLDVLISIVTGLGLVVGLAFLVAPVAALFAGLFTDQIATVVESVWYPGDPPGRDPPALKSLRDAIGFTGIVILVNLAALALLLVPGVNAVAFLVGNGYLLGREFFEAAARRYLGREEARAARQAYQGKVFVGGLLIALFAAVPILNLLTPLFATAFMVHFYKIVVEGSAVAPR